MVLAAAAPDDGQSREALADLCSTYWYPIYAFIRRQGMSAHAAEDLTQEFFARVMEKQFLRDVSPEKGRFRSFLLVCARRFVANERDRQRAQKRGGGHSPVSIDFRDADDRYRLEPASSQSPERAYQRRWALTVLEQALAALERELAAESRQSIFEVLKIYLAADRDAPPYAQSAKTLGMSEGAVRVAVHRLRERYAAAVRREIGRTVEDPADIEAEVQELFAAVGPE